MLPVLKYNFFKGVFLVFAKVMDHTHRPSRPSLGCITLTQTYVVVRPAFSQDNIRVYEFALPWRRK